MKGYKFRDWNEHYHKQVLTELNIYFASPDTFNDPFDCKVPVRYELESDEYLYDYLKELYLSNESIIDENELDERIQNTIIRLRDKDSEKIGIEDKEKLISENYGIFSLAGDCSNILLWSHYANYHKGFCIEYDLHVLDRFFSHLFRYKDILVRGFPVEYSNKMKVLQPSKLNKEERFEWELKYKYKDWSYEQEYRFVLVGMTNKSLLIPPKSITKIIFGYKMPNEHKEEVLKIIKDKKLNVVIMEAKRNPYSYNLKFIEIKL